MPEIKAVFLEVIDRTHNVKSFRFSKPEDFSFEAGQFVQVLFDTQNRKNKDLNKMLSLSSPPEEPYVEVTKKISSSAFSQALVSLKEGDEVFFQGPMGKCSLSALTEDVCFLVGGIGITPVFPILKSVADKALQKNIVLIYGNWTEQDIVFREELDELKDKIPGLRVCHVLAETESAQEDVFKGMITKEVIQSCAGDYLAKEFFILGPPSMVDSMKTLCGQMGINKEKIKVESFIGY